MGLPGRELIGDSGHTGKDWITDQIAIGNFLDAESLPDGVDAVLCLREDFCDGRTDVDALCIPLFNGPDGMGAGDCILVHCHAGRSRSVVVVTRFLMQSRDHWRKWRAALWFFVSMMFLIYARLQDAVGRY